MRTFLVECFWPGVTEEAFANGAERARATARELRAIGRDVAFLGAVLVLRDEIAFWRFACESPRVLDELSSLAELSHERVLECVEVSGDA